MGFEPTPSAVQMRPDESATVRLHPECAANVDILIVGAGWSIRPVSATTAWVGVRLVSKLDFIWWWNFEPLPAARSWPRIGEEWR